MFTGIIQEIGNIMEIDSHELDKQIIFKTEKKFLDDMNIGDSLSINGVCLSVVETKDDTFSVDVSNETIKLTNNQKEFLTIRDTLCQIIYNLLFNYIVKQINNSMNIQN